MNAKRLNGLTKPICVALVALFIFIAMASAPAAPISAAPFPSATLGAVPLANPAAQGKIVGLSQVNNGQGVALDDKSVLVISLDVVPSTGYHWDIAQLDDKLLRQVGEIEFQSTANMPGAPAKQIVRLVGVGKGQTNIALGYHRTWESGVSVSDLNLPSNTYAVAVTVGGAFQGSLPALQSDAVAAEAVAPAAVEADSTLPAHYNVCDKGGCTPIKNQGPCGSCWAFSSAGTFEQVLKMKTGVTFDLAEQYLVSCNSDGWSCSGGWNDKAMNYWLNKIPAGEPAAGAVLEANDPYKAANTACNAPHAHGAKLSSWSYVDGRPGTVPSVNALKNAILKYGPLSVDVCVNGAFQNYRGGVFAGPGCNAINHAVILTGWDDATGAWYLRNSWGTSWGEGGNMRIKYGVSVVGYGATYVVAGPLPTPAPTKAPTQTPTKVPTKTFTPVPTKTPTKAPTKTPTKVPTKTFTPVPTKTPTKAPTKAPTKTFTPGPTKTPIVPPTATFTPGPTQTPTEVPTQILPPEPTLAPTAYPS